MGEMEVKPLMSLIDQIRTDLLDSLIQECEMVKNVFLMKQSKNVNIDQLH